MDDYMHLFKIIKFPHLKRNQKIHDEYPVNLKIPLRPFALSDVDSSKVSLSNNNFIVTRITPEYRDVFVKISPKISADQCIVIQVLETNPTLIGGLRLHIKDLKNNSPRLVYSDRKCAPNDYLMFWLSEIGQVKIKKNGEEDVKCPPLFKTKTDQYQLLGEMYGTVTQLRVYVGNRSEAVPFVKIPPNLDAIPADASNGLPSNSIYPSLDTTTYLFCELRHNIITLTNVKFPQNPSTANNPQAIGPDSNLLHNICQTKSNRREDEASEDKLCKICMETEVNAVIIPCGHMCFCYKCAERVRIRSSNLCPICRSDIKQTQKVYFS